MARASDELSRNAAQGTRIAGMRVKRDPLDTATRHQVLLERASTDVANRVVKQSDEFAKNAIALLKDADEVSEISLRDFRKLTTEVQSAGKKALGAAKRKIHDSLAPLAKQESAFNARELATYSKDKIAKLPAKDALQAVMTKPIPATGQFANEMLDSWSTSELQALNNLIAKGRANGWSNSQLIKAIKGTRGAEFADGLNARIRANVSTVTRTLMQHTAATTRNETWQLNSDVVTGYQIVAVLDDKTTAQCRGLDQLCRDGLVFKLGKGPKPPLHHNCRSTMVPVLTGDKDNTEDTAESEGYYTWLKRQPSDFQDAAIGPTRAKLLRDGGLTAEEFAKLSLNRRFQPLTLDEMRKLEPLAFKRAGIE
jgi:SPP1 gp7 family putative phage head morphogenesis protein